MNQVEFERLQRRERELEAEVVRLQASIKGQDRVPNRIAAEAGRSTLVGHDELLSAAKKTRMPMILTDPNQPDNPIIFANQAFQDLSGYSSDELLGRNCRFLQGPDTDPAEVTKVRDALAAQRDIAVEILNYRRDGTSFINELFVSPVFDRDGRLLFHFGSQLDITGFRRTRREVEASERRQRAIFDSAVDFAIIATDQQGQVTDWNAGAEHVLGWSADDMRGQTADRFFTPEDRATDRIGTEMRLALEQGRASDERWHLRRDGVRFWASGEMMPLRDESGEHLGFIKVLRDRTPEHRAGEALREAEAALRRAQVAGGVGVFSIDTADNVLRATPEFCRLYGVPVRDRLPPEEIERLVLPEHAAVASSIGSRATGDVVPDVEYRVRRADTGEVRWIARRAEVERDEVGRPLRFFGVVRDTTAQHAAQDALAASEAHWRGLFERLREGLIVGEVVRGADGQVIDWRYLDVNPAWGDLVGLPSNTVVGRTVRELIPDIEDVWIDQVAKVVEDGEPATFVQRVGTLRRWYEGRVHHIGADRFTIIFREVTQQHEAERRRAARHELSDRLRGDIDPSALALLGCELIGRTLDVGRVGYGRVEADGETFVVERDWTAPDCPSLAGRYRMDDYGAYAAELRRGDVVVVPDVWLDPRTASTADRLDAVSTRALINIPVLEQDRLVAVLYVNDAQPRAWTTEDATFTRDMAERMRQAIERRYAEQELRNLAASLERQVEERTRDLRDAEDFTRLALSSVGGVGAWTYDAASDRFFFSPAIAELYGLDPIRAEEGVTPAEFTANVHPDDKAALAATMAGGLERAGDLELEYRICQPDGAVRWVLSRGYTYHDEGKPVRRVGIGVETTQQHQLAEQLRQSQKMEAVGQLTGGLAHDFNNLLTGITGSLELLSTRIGQGRLKDLDRYVNAAQGAAKRAAALTHRLLAFSRQQTLDPKPTDVNRLVGGMEDLIRRTVGPAVTIEVVGAAGLWPTLVDPPQLENALLNLCINARDAMPDGGRLTIETANRWLDQRTARERDLQPGQYVSLCVSDSGTGMPPEVIAKAFDPFFTTKPLGQGTGLGLSMIYGFVRQSGGQARIYSETGQGTTVCLYLPRHLGEAETVEAMAELANAPRAGQGETVLVVDDEPTVRMLVAEVLEELGYAAIEAADGVAGLRVLQSDARVDLLVTDVGLPGGMNGRQMADAARVGRPDLKVLFITGYAENAVVGNGHLDHGMHVITKPFAMEVLASRIKELIAGR